MCRFRFSVISFFIFSIVLLAISACQKSPKKVSQLSNLETFQMLDQWVLDYELMGASVLLIADGEIKLQYFSGYSRVSDSVRTSQETTYRIASISKTFTTLGVMKLVDEGILDLNEDVSAYLGWEFRNPRYADQKITLAHILNHQSSIRDGEGYGKFISAMSQGSQKIQDLFQPSGLFFTEDMFGEQPIGEYFSYSNCSWGLVASIIEKQSGMRFDRFMKQYILEPMGVKGSFNIMDVPVKNMATLYRIDGEEQWKAQTDDVVVNAPTDRAPQNYVLGDNGLIYGPQGSLRASAFDLFQLAKLLMHDGLVDGNQILSSARLDQMRSNKWTYDGSNGNTWDHFWMSYGKGLHFITNSDSADIIFPDRKMQGHSGIAYGLLSNIYVDPGSESGVIFITNGSKQKYEYGPQTSFYEVEEALFNILHPLLVQFEKQ